jgi:hypothetical protein
MALTKEQFSELRKKGLSTDQIVRFEKGETPVPSGYSFEQFTDDLVTGATDIAKLPADFLNQFAFDVPRQLANKYAPGSYEANFEIDNPTLSSIQKAGGVAGAMVGGGKLVQGVSGALKSKRMFDTSLGGEKVARAGGFIPNVFAGKTGTGIISGGIEGGLRQEGADYEPRRVAEGAAIGATVGGLAVPVAQGVGRAMQKTFSGIPKSLEEAPAALGEMNKGRAIKITQKRTPEQKISEIKTTGKRLIRGEQLAQREQTLGAAKDLSEKAAELQKQKDYLRQKSVSLGKNRAERTAIYQRGLAELRERGRAELASATAKINQEIDGAIATGARDIQTSLPSMFSEATASFGSRLKTIDESRILNEMEVRQFFTDTLTDSSVRGGPVFDAIQEKAAKYGVNFTWENGIPKISGLTKQVKIGQLQNDIAEIGGRLSSQAKGGDRFMAADIPYAVMQDNLAKFVPELQQLRGEYKPVLLAMKQAGRIFRPRLGEAGTRGAERFLKRGADGKWDSQDKWLIDMVSKPTKFTSGIGGVTENVSFLGKSKQDAIKIVRNNSEKQINAIKAKYAKQMAETRGDREKTQLKLLDLGTELRTAKEQADLANKAVQMGQVKDAQEWNDRLIYLAKREAKLQGIREAQKKAAFLKQAIGYGAAGVVAIGGATAAGRAAASRGAASSQNIEQALSN